MENLSRETVTATLGVAVPEVFYLTFEGTVHTPPSDGWPASCDIRGSNSAPFTNYPKLIESYPSWCLLYRVRYFSSFDFNRELIAVSDWKPVNGLNVPVDQITEINDFHKPDPDQHFEFTGNRDFGNESHHWAAFIDTNFDLARSPFGVVEFTFNAHWDEGTTNTIRVCFYAGVGT